MDIRMTRDGELVVFHDETVERTTDGTGVLKELTLRELKGLDAGSWFDARFAGERVPTLKEVLERCKDKAHLHIEMKVAGEEVAGKLVKLLDKHQMHDQVTVISFMKEALAQVKEASAEERLGWLVTRWDETVLEETLALGTRLLCSLASTVTPEKVALAHQKGLLVRTWGVKSDMEIQRMFQCRVDGTTLDAPDRAWSISRMSINQ